MQLCKFAWLPSDIAPSCKPFVCNSRNEMMVPCWVVGLFRLHSWCSWGPIFWQTVGKRNIATKSDNMGPSIFRKKKKSRPLAFGADFWWLLLRFCCSLAENMGLQQGPNGPQTVLFTWFCSGRHRAPNTTFYGSQRGPPRGMFTNLWAQEGPQRALNLLVSPIPAWVSSVAIFLSPTGCRQLLVWEAR